MRERGRVGNVRSLEAVSLYWRERERERETHTENKGEKETENKREIGRERGWGRERERLLSCASIAVATSRKAVWIPASQRNSAGISNLS